MSENTVSTGNTVRPTGSISHPSDRVLRPIDRMADALASPDWQPTRAQVAQLIEMAERSGYERGRDAGLAEAWQHMLDTPETPPFSAMQIAETEKVQRHRARYDAWAGSPHRRDYCGGPVAVWE